MQSKDQQSSNPQYAYMGAQGYNLAKNAAIPQSQGRRQQDSIGDLYRGREETTKINWKNVGNKSLAYKGIQYSVTFRVQIKVNFGETLCVLGSLPELGKWTEFKHHLQWTDGHIWESVTPLITHSYYFQYKYALLDKNGTELINWEKGIDRLADMEIMPDVKMGGSSYNQALSGGEVMQTNSYSSSTGIKHIHYNDVWEEYNMSFTIWHPVEEGHEDWIFDNNRATDVQMHKMPRQIDWLDVKYGRPMQPIQVTMKMK